MKSSVIALTVAAALAAGSVPAFARDHGGAPHQQQWNHAAVANHRFEHRDAARWAYSAPRYYGHQRYYQPAYVQPYYAPGYYYDNGPDTGDLVGAAILGALAGGLVGQLAAGH